MDSKIKLIALSVSLLASTGSVAALGGLRVNSGLGEPFSATVTVTGKEAKELLRGTKLNLSDNRLKANVRKSGNDAIVSLSSSSAINEPVIVFQMGVKGQSRQYTAVLDPSSTKAKAAVAEAKKVEREAAEKKNPVPDSGKKKMDAAPVATSGQHTVQTGETLTIIAEQLKPANMPVDQAVRALINANQKKLGRNPNQLFTGVVLDLPSSFKQSTAVQVEKEPVKVKFPRKPAEEVKEKEQVKPVEEKTEPKKQEPIATEPQEKIVKQEVVEDSKPFEQVSPVQPISEVQQASKEEVSAAPSLPVVSEEESAKIKPQPAEAENADFEDEGGSLWKLVLAGGIGLTIILLLAKLFLDRNAAAKSRQDNQPGEETPFDEQNDGIRLHQPIAKPEHPKAPITKETAMAETAMAADDVEDDDVFFEVVGKDKSVSQDDGFDLNLNALAIDEQQVGIVSSAVTDDEETLSRANADWDSIESTDSVFEPDDFGPVKNASTTPPAVEPSPAPVETVTTESAPVLDWSEAVETEQNEAAKETITSWASPEAIAKYEDRKTAISTHEVVDAAEKEIVETATVSWAENDIPQVAEIEEPLEFAVVSSEEIQPVVETPQAGQEVFAEDIQVATETTVEDALEFVAPDPAEVVAATPIEEKTVEPAEEALAFVMDDQPFDTDTPSEPEAVKADVETPAPTLSFALEPMPVERAEVSQPSVEVEAVESAETVEFEPVAVPETALVEEPQPAAVEPLSFEAEEPFAPEVAVPEISEPEIPEVESVSVPAVETAQVAEEEVVETVAAEGLPDFNVQIPEVQEAPAVQAEPEVSAAGSKGWSDNEVDFSDTNITFDDGSADSSDDLAIDWSDLDMTEGDSKPAFVSESVGMTAPLEAKYELAEMYIEIGDPEAARETLNELIEESSGEIQAKSRALLNSIGG
ncbi:FimV/HubP family polar landmark protein [Neisseria elongata]|uniref:FimV/HubP family polar landmark protein n=1 Tax=Neisseria elongata TaxID=495 RepID=UPI000A4CE006|nr:FimV/HubP family polar landmark protein [Neisseria elongata]